jgi:ABC-type iron transport system FetAB ATPase subunit
MIPFLEPYSADKGQVGFDRKGFRRLLSKGIQISRAQQLAPQDETIRLIADGIARNSILFVGGHTLSDAEFFSFATMLVEHAHKIFLEKVTSNDQAFRSALATLGREDERMLHALLENLERLRGQIKTDIAQVHQITEQNLGLSRKILQEVEYTNAGLSSVQVTMQTWDTVLSRLDMQSRNSSPVNVTANLRTDLPPDYPPYFSFRNSVISELCNRIQETNWLAIVGSSGRGKTLLARSVVDTCNFPYWWVSLVGKKNGEASLHIMRQLARRLAYVEGNLESWTLFSDGLYTLEDLAVRLVSQERENFVFVIDNLPEFNFDVNTLSKIITLSNLFVGTKIKLITTGNYRAEVSLGLSIASAPWSTPSFSE